MNGINADKKPINARNGIERPGGMSVFIGKCELVPSINKKLELRDKFVISLCAMLVRPFAPIIECG
jgi:hypothetical protein